jgi:DNA-binding NarL/FixJ family response regulator
MRVVVADDSLLIREGLARLLIDAGCDVVATAADGVALLREVELNNPDAVVVDIKMPPTQTDAGLEAARKILESHPGVGVLVLSQYLESAYAMRLISEAPGHVGYLLKDRVFDIAVLVDGAPAAYRGRVRSRPDDRVSTHAQAARPQSARLAH